MSVELKPCPFCGGKATDYIPNFRPHDPCSVGCDYCEVWFEHHDYDEAVSEWNKRVPDAALAAARADGIAQGREEAARWLDAGAVKLNSVASRMGDLSAAAAVAQTASDIAACAAAIRALPAPGGEQG